MSATTPETSTTPDVSSAWCRCCAENDCPCQATDVILVGNVPTCRCCIDICECGAHDVALHTH